MGMGSHPLLIRVKLFTCVSELSQVFKKKVDTRQRTYLRVEVVNKGGPTDPRNPVGDTSHSNVVRKV